MTTGNAKAYISFPCKLNRIIDNGWEFVFLGANIDAAETAESIGISRETAVDYHCDVMGSEVQYNTMCAAVTSVRKGKKLSSSLGWRKAADEDFRGRK